MDDDISPSKRPFITMGDHNSDIGIVDDGPASPFHAMVEGGTGINTGSVNGRGSGISGTSSGSNSLLAVETSRTRSPPQFAVPPTEGEIKGDVQMVHMNMNMNTNMNMASPTATESLQMPQDSAEDDDDNSSTVSTLKVYQGTADFDYDMNTVTHSKWQFGKTKRGIIKVFYMSIFAMLGAFLRMILAQLFGEECKNPGTIGWLKAGQPLCVTADGETSISGGIIFADFPANLLGSFIMGLMQGTDTMGGDDGLPKTLPIAWLNENHKFQSDHAIHLAIKTGFCGSLTTFSSWNSEMVMMLLGEDADRGSLFFRALFGYFIGVETCIASFILGKNIARYIFAKVNPALELEHAESKRRKECGVYINTELSDFERRFLSGFDMGEHDIYINPEAVHYLEKWRLSTEECRRTGHNLLPLLTDVEYQTMALDEPLTRELIVPSIEAEWDIESLENWVYMKKKLDLKGGGNISKHEFKFTPAFLLFLIAYILLFFGIFYLQSEDTYTITYRTMLYAGLVAPFGALFRWKLSGLNGSIQRCNWFPLGTFVANIIACIVSAAMVGIEPRFYEIESFWAIGTVRALKVGFSGCLSTVSTFVAEIAGFLSSPTPLKGYLYVSITIAIAALCGAVTYTIFDSDVGNDYY